MTTIQENEVTLLPLEEALTILSMLFLDLDREEFFKPLLNEEK
jgi:hypothetical protein